MERNGFTIVENMISMVLLAIVLTGGIIFFHNSSQWKTLATHRKIATEIVNSKLENYKRLGYLSLPHPSAPQTLPVSIAGISAQQLVSVTDIDDPVNGSVDYKKVDVEVTWVEINKNTTRKIEATAYMAP